MKRTLWLALAIIPFLLNAAAAEKITVDPNTPGSCKVVQNADSDPRLAKKVNYDCKAKPIRDVLSELSSKTGIALAAGSNSGDWPVRDARITMFVKDIPLVDVMNSMARVMKFAWSKSGNKPGFSYRLVSDKQAAKDLEDRLCGRGKEALAKRKTIIAQLEKVAALTDAEAAPLKEQSPFLYIMHKSGLAGALTRLMRQVPQISTAISSGEDTAVKYADLSKPAQATVTDIIRGSTWLMSGGDPDSEITDEDLKEMFESPGWQVSFQNRFDDDYMMRPDVMGMYGIVMVGQGAEGGIPIGDPDNAYVRMMSKEMIADIEGGEGRRNHRMSKEEQQALEQLEMDAGYCEPSVKHEPDPELQAKVKGGKRCRGQLSMLVQLSSASSFSFIADSYKMNEHCRMRIPNEEKPLQDFITACFKNTSFSWEKHGSIIEIWDRNWLQSKKGEIPDGLKEKWEKQIEETGTLDLDSIAELASLTDMQIETNMYSDPFFNESGNLFSQLERSGDYLNAYNQLSKYQRNALFTAKGLGISSLNAKQRETLFDIAGNIDIPEGIPNLAASGVDLRAVATKAWDGQRYIYTFRGTINGALIPSEYIISSPIFTFRTREEMMKKYSAMEGDGEYYKEDYSDEEYNEDDTEPPYDGPSDQSYDESYDEGYDEEYDEPSDDSSELPGAPVDPAYAEPQDSPADDVE